ncbi:MAG: hypothetical protein LQ338_007398 [Usnochroma carphineum]|nr:MAG: hypothetical protein LQ338_007398 [Usnochroma carphineum]
MGMSAAPSDRQIKPSSRSRDSAIRAHARPEVDSRPSTSRSLDSQPRSSRFHAGGPPPSQHLRPPSHPPISSKVPNLKATTRPIDNRTNSKIGIPINKPKNAPNVPRQVLVEEKLADAITNPKRNISRPTVRAPSSTSAGPESNPESAELPPEVIRQLQGKLLSLHILHSASAQVHQQWRESAKTHFQKQFAELVDRHTEIADIAYQTQELRNRAALADWSRNLQAPEIARRARTLSRCIQEIYENLDPRGRYSQVIGAFEAWFDRAREVRESRETRPPDEVAVSGYVEELGAGWQNDVDALQRKLSTLTGDLRTLGSASADSTLGQLLVMLQDLVIDMLAEVDCIRSIECEIVAQEELWMEEQIRSLGRKVQDEMGGSRKTPRKR